MSDVVSEREGNKERLSGVRYKHRSDINPDTPVIDEKLTDLTANTSKLKYRF